MLKVLRLVLGTIVVVLAAYALITKNSGFASLIILPMGFFALVSGLSEFKEKRRENGLNLIFVSVFIFIVTIVIFLS